MQMVRRLAIAQEKLITKMMSAGLLVLQRAEPELARLGQLWPLDEPHPFTRSAQLARELARQAAAAAAEAAMAAPADNAANSGALSMERLADFLPATSSGKGGSKKKTAANGSKR